MNERITLDRIAYRNFKVLRHADLPLGPFTLIVGANGSGKSTALEPLEYFQRGFPTRGEVVSVKAATTDDVAVGFFCARHLGETRQEQLVALWPGASPRDADSTPRLQGVSPERGNDHGVIERLKPFLERARVYDFHPEAMARPVTLTPGCELARDGGGLAGVLDRLRDQAPERFAALQDELHRWLPEFDAVLFDVPEQGKRSVVLRTSHGGGKIAAPNLSHGTLFALGILALAYEPKPPTVIAFEDPDRGMHPRLLERVQEALYRLAYPQRFDEDREPVQVIATTHSPYFLDLFREHPEEIVIAEKRADEAVFERLSERADIEEILQGAPLGDIWYSGVLGGVPAEP